MVGRGVGEEAELSGLVAEYRSVMGERGAAVEEWDEVEARLAERCEWSAEGSWHLAGLARRYGAFVLRNALALAIAMGVEDGELGL